MKGRKLTVELTLYSLIKKFWEQGPRIVGSGLVFAGLAYLGLSYFPKYYGHSALIQVANLGPMVPASTTYSSPLKALNGTANEGLKSEALKFIEYKYIENPDAQKASARVAKIAELKGSDLLELTSYGLTPQAARDHALAVLNDLKAQYQPRLDDLRRDADTNLAVLEQQRKSLEASLSNISSNLDKFGYSATLVQQRGDMELALVKVQTSLNQIQATLSPEKTYNFSIKHQYPLDSGPVFPNVSLITSIGFLIGCAVMMFAIFLRMEDETVRDQIFRLENSGIFRLPAGMQGSHTGPITNPFIDTTGTAGNANATLEETKKKAA